MEPDLSLVPLSPISLFCYVTVSGNKLTFISLDKLIINLSHHLILDLMTSKAQAELTPLKMFFYREQNCNDCLQMFLFLALI